MIEATGLTKRYGGALAVDALRIVSTQARRSVAVVARLVPLVRHRAGPTAR